MLNSKIKLLKLKNPYQEETVSWNCFMDIQITTDDGKKLISIIDLIDEHGISLTFYKEELPILIKDGLIELID